MLYISSPTSRHSLALSTHDNKSFVCCADSGSGAGWRDYRCINSNGDMLIIREAEACYDTGAPSMRPLHLPYGHHSVRKVEPMKERVSDFSWWATASVWQQALDQLLRSWTVGTRSIGNVIGLISSGVPESASSAAKVLCSEGCPPASPVR